MLAHQYSVLGEKNWLYPPTASGSYGRGEGREGGRLADEMWVGFEIFKILCRLTITLKLAALPGVRPITNK